MQPLRLYNRKCEDNCALHSLDPRPEVTRGFGGWPSDRRAGCH